MVRAFRRPSFKSWLNLNVVSYAVTSIVNHYNTSRHALKLQQDTGLIRRLLPKRQNMQDLFKPVELEFCVKEWPG